MLNIIGLGLRGSRSLTLESLEVLKSCDTLYFETYTSISPETAIEDLRELTGKPVHEADRDFVESERDLIDEASRSNVCLLVTGDPLTATTHNQLRLDARLEGVETRIFENSSVLSVIPGALGLMHYRFGPPVSLPFVSSNFFPTSVYDKIEKNFRMNLHTLLLLDLKDGRTMPVQDAIGILEELEKRKKNGILIPERRICIAIAVSQPGEKIYAGTIENVKKSGVDGYPAALVIPSKLNESEETFLTNFAERL